MTLAVNHDEEIICFLTVSFERMTGLVLVLFLQRPYFVFLNVSYDGFLIGLLLLTCCW